MQKIVANLWFDDKAEEAVNLYVSLIKNSRVGMISRYNAESAKVAGRPEGSIMTIHFQLDGQDFIALNGGPVFKFTEAISLMVNCDTQEEIDRLWAALTANGGSESVCGWLKDKYGLSWQIVPTELGEMMNSGESEKIERMWTALLKMKKLNIAELKMAYDGK